MIPPPPTLKSKQSRPDCPHSVHVFRRTYPLASSTGASKSGNGMSNSAKDVAITPDSNPSLAATLPLR